MSLIRMIEPVKQSLTHRKWLQVHDDINTTNEIFIMWVCIHISSSYEKASSGYSEKWYISEIFITVDIIFPFAKTWSDARLSLRSPLAVLVFKNAFCAS